MSGVLTLLEKRKLNQTARSRAQILVGCLWQPDAACLERFLGRRDGFKDYVYGGDGTDALRKDRFDVVREVEKIVDTLG